MKARKRIPAISKKRAAEWKVYLPLKRKFLKANPFCQRCMYLWGWNAATQVHHYAGRRSNFLKVETWRASCDACNLFAKNHPKEARAEGWIAPVGVYLT